MDKNSKKYLAIAKCLLIGLIATKSTDWQSALLGRTVIGGLWPALALRSSSRTSSPKAQSPYSWAGSPGFAYSARR